MLGNQQWLYSCTSKRVYPEYDPQLDLHSIPYVKKLFKAALASTQEMLGLYPAKACIVSTGGVRRKAQLVEKPVTAEKASMIS